MPSNRFLKSIGEIYSIFAVDRFHFLSATYPLCKGCVGDQVRVKEDQTEVKSPIFSFWGLGHYSYFLIGREGDLEKKVLYKVDRDRDQKEDRGGDREKDQAQDQQKTLYYGLSGREYLLHDIKSSYWSLFWESVVLHDRQAGNLEKYRPIEEVLKEMSEDDVLLWIRLRYDSHFPSPEGQNILNSFNERLKDEVTKSFFLLRSSSWPNVSYLLITNWSNLKEAFNRIVAIFGPHLVRSDTYLLFPIHTLYRCSKDTPIKPGANISFVTSIYILGKNYREVVMTETDEFELHIESIGDKEGEDESKIIKVYSRREDIPQNERQRVVPVKFSLEPDGSLIDNTSLIKVNIGDKFMFYLKFVHMKKIIDKNQCLYEIKIKKDSLEKKGKGENLENGNRVVLEFSKTNLFSGGNFYITKEKGFQKNSIIRIKGFRKTRSNNELQELFVINLETECLFENLDGPDDSADRSPIDNFVESIEKIDSEIEVGLLTGVSDIQVRIEASSPQDLLKKLSLIQKYADRYGLLIKTLTSLDLPSSRGN